MQKAKWIGLTGIAALLLFLWFWTPRDSSPVPFLNEDVEIAQEGPAWGAFQVWMPGADSCTEAGLLARQVQSIRPLGVLLENIPISEFQDYTHAIGRDDLPALASRSYPLLHRQFSHTQTLPGPQTLAAIPHLKASLLQIDIEQCLALGVNLRLLPMEDLQPATWNELGVLAFAQPQLPRNLDTVAWLIAFQEQLRPLVNAGLSGLYLDRSFWQRLPIHPYLLRKLLREDLGFEGLLLTDYLDPDQTRAQLSADADLWLVGSKRAALSDQLETLYRQGALPGDWLAKKQLRLERARQWMSRYRAGKSVAPIQASLAGLAPAENRKKKEWQLDAYFNDRRWEYLRWKWQRESMVLASNPQQLLPFRELSKKDFHLWTLSSPGCFPLEERLRKFVNLQTHILDPAEDLGRAFPAGSKPNSVHILVLNDIELDPQLHRPFLLSLRQLAQQVPVVVLNFGQADNLPHLSRNFAIVQSFERNTHAMKLAGDLLFGSFSPTGRLPDHYGARFPKGHGLTFSSTRVHYSLPQDVGIAPEKLVGIDAIALTAIAEGAMPGCQVVVAKNGRVVYSKAFGRHTYEKGSRRVHTSDLYDLASITKVASTTLMAMKLYEEGTYGLNDRLRKHLDLKRNSHLRAISMKDLLSHQTGLPSVLPVLPLLEQPRPGGSACDLLFCSSPSAPYLVQVADSFYFDQRYHDTLWQQLQEFPVKRSPRFRYSDVNFMLLQRILETRSGRALDQWAYETVYKPLGLRHMTFQPKDRFSDSRIVPTEQDRSWRKQLVHGYVHDPVAALYGGVSGHAGLFGNAEDLAILFQMLANEGEYGGVRFFDPKTIALFTSDRWGNHRGLGFDKPGHRSNQSAHAEDVSSATFGHTGFTGTCVWVDPQEDLVFVFLSNRVHPSSKNRSLISNRVRSRIHQVVYDALDTFDPSLPALLPPEQTNDFFPMH